MRHAKKFNHLGRTAPHRKAMLANMATSLILNKRITTTIAKAKALKMYVEPLITKSKSDTTHSRRVVFSYLQDKTSAHVLFNEVAEKVADRPGGYTRIIKLGNRLGDNADMCLIELVDFNEVYQQEDSTKKTRTRRSRRAGSGTKKDKTAETTQEAKPVAAAAKEKTKEEAAAEEAPEVEAKDQSSETEEEAKKVKGDHSDKSEGSSESEEKEDK
ncbi:50S ribosomal protein L17 [Catalinimonas niigatensis]|uniref:50S ribosomal protein L17 n=1 Tax=Catalinimonas niigatensis TaxID=1397264 RepID=UPI002665BF96|nr:50S ribosomal protein L17 [Catalinimonas niigatensis]WPP52490.1 50S ribosomal protein L17 [Catalinimonas niigatensis]